MKEIVIKGSIDELVECEFYLVMVMGYEKSNENWNNGVFERNFKLDRIKCYSKNKPIQYHYHPRDGFTISAKQFLSQFK